MVLQVDDPGGGIGAFDIFSKLEEIPSVAMSEGGIGGAMNLVGTINNMAVKINRAGRENLAGRSGIEPKVEAINPLPHLAGNVFSKCAGIFAGSVLWWFLLSSGVGLFFRHHFTESRIITLNRVTAVALAVLGVWALISGIHGYLK